HLVLSVFALCSSSCPPFPTRRSSDLLVMRSASRMNTTGPGSRAGGVSADPRGFEPGLELMTGRRFHHPSAPVYGAHSETSWRSRSEEHTSELQSLRHLVCRLLLEKKK